MALAQIRLPAALRPTVEGSPTVTAVGTTVGSALRDFAHARPAAVNYLFGPDGRLRRSFAFFLNGVDIRNLDGEATEVHDGDVVAIVPALSGG
ncbi:MAG TPA: MoaD/ThiS family protein [Thermoplasmata archaeon]|nr:MoaD/ThiS family protein [Thermoplasmata archaeon]